MISRRLARHRLTARYDRFNVREPVATVGFPTEDAGHSLTAAWLTDWSDRFQTAAEVVTVRSRNTARVFLGESLELTERQMMLSFRYRITWSR